MAYIPEDTEQINESNISRLILKPLASEIFFI